MSDIDSQFDSKGAAVLTEEDIQRCFDNLFKKYQKIIVKQVFDKVLSQLAKSAVSFLVGIIVTVFIVFNVLDKNISVTKENLELKAQMEKMATKIYQLEHSNQKVK